MKKCVFLFIPLLIFSLNLFAQEKRDTIRKVNRSSIVTAKEKRNAIIDSLDLTKAQGKKMKGINKEFRAQLKEVKENNQLSAVERKEKNKELLKKRQEEIQKILSPEQMSTYRRLIKEQRNNKNEDMLTNDVNEE